MKLTGFKKLKKILEVPSWFIGSEQLLGGEKTL